jgi:ribonucleoside-diphosphate reductase alpha chain
LTRQRLPDTRASITKTLRIKGQENAWHVSVGLFENGSPGEVFIWPQKEGSEVSCLADGMAIMMSMALQHGVPMETIASKLVAVKSPQAGSTGDPEFPMVHGYLDYLGRWLKARFCVEAKA